MVGFLLASIMSLSYGSMSIYWRIWAKRKVSTWAILVSSFFILPFFLLLGLYGYLQAGFQNSQAYWMFLICWWLLNCLNLLGLVWLYQYLSLSQSKALKQSMTIAVSILIGVILGEYEFSLSSLIAGVAFAVAAFLLNGQGPESEERKGLFFYSLVMFVMALFEVAKLHFYQKALWLQSSVFVHQGITATIMTCTFLFFGFKQFCSFYKQGILKKREIFYFNLFTFIGVMLEAFVLNLLSVSDFVLISVFVGLLYIYVDFRLKDVLPDKRGLLGAFLLLVGLLMSFVSRA